MFYTSSSDINVSIIALFFFLDSIVSFFFTFFNPTIYTNASKLGIFVSNSSNHCIQHETEYYFTMICHTCMVARNVRKNISCYKYLVQVKIYSPTLYGSFRSLQNA